MVDFTPSTGTNQLVQTIRAVETPMSPIPSDTDSDSDTENMTAQNIINPNNGFRMILGSMRVGMNILRLKEMRVSSIFKIN